MDEGLSGVQQTSPWPGMPLDYHHNHGDDTNGNYNYNYNNYNSV
jgi:hypothetical protein